MLEDVTLALPERGLFALCGPNGAGKSTLLNVIGGSVPPSSGQVILNGADITRRPPHERFYQGISRTFQSVHLIKGRTVLDNVAVACLASHKSSIVTRIARSRLDEARAAGVAGRWPTWAWPTWRAGRSPASRWRRSGWSNSPARSPPTPACCSSTNPPPGCRRSSASGSRALLTTLADRTCVLLVEHDLALVAQVSERIFVLSAGRLVFDGGPADFRSSPVVNTLLVGS